MSGLQIVRGSDILLKADDEILFGMTEFYAEEKINYHNIYEYLCAEPLHRLPESASYTIKLGVMTLFSHRIPSDNSFTLSVICGGREYLFEECRVTAIKSEVKGESGGSQVFMIEAERMRERVIEDE